MTHLEGNVVPTTFQGLVAAKRPVCYLLTWQRPAACSMCAMVAGLKDQREDPGSGDPPGFAGEAVSWYSITDSTDSGASHSGQRGLQQQSDIVHGRVQHCGVLRVWSRQRRFTYALQRDARACRRRGRSCTRHASIFRCRSYHYDDTSHPHSNTADGHEDTVSGHNTSSRHDGHPPPEGDEFSSPLAAVVDVPNHSRQPYEWQTEHRRRCELQRATWPPAVVHIEPEPVDAVGGPLLLVPPRRHQPPTQQHRRWA
ncbi:hypothetical protein BJ912DRAFT_1062581 [Pholiota molesta]|nr:hypothetical protein BJ912DRAFT_1062581 [Pholiota molesta]